MTKPDPPPDDILLQTVLEQLQRYAEDFGILTAEYEKLLAEYRLQKAGRIETTIPECGPRDFDATTGLPNRDFFVAYLNRTLDHTRRLAVLRMKLEASPEPDAALAERMLEEISSRVVRNLRASDLLSYFAPGDFGLILHDLGVAGIRKLADHILVAVNSKLCVGNETIAPRIDIGIGLYPDEGETSEILLTRAEAALEQARVAGGNTYRFFDEALNRDLGEALRYKAFLRNALQKKQFFLVYQPQVDTEGWRIVGVEALLRWNHPELGIVPPDIFVPMLEDMGLILSTGYWVLRTACLQQVAWKNQGLQNLRMAVNISPFQLGDPFFVRTVMSVVQETGIEFQDLELEITESQLMENLDLGIDKLEQLRELGIGIAIDDFGTGYSSLARLRSLPITKLKIDKSFIQHLHADVYGEAIPTSILELANRLHLETVAEGVETAEQIRYLVKNECRELQGYYLARPMSSTGVGQLVANNGGAFKLSLDFSSLNG